MAAFNYLQTFGKGGASTWNALFPNRSNKNNVERTFQDGAHGVPGELETRITLFGVLNAELARIEAANPEFGTTARVSLDDDANGVALADIPIDNAFIESYTNSRIEDLCAAASDRKGRKVADGVNAIIVPGSTLTRLRAEAEGLDRVFHDAGFDWRPESECSICLAMNDDIAMDGERLASSANRNFEGPQGRCSRNHLMSPAMFAAAAISGHLADVRTFRTKQCQYTENHHGSCRNRCR